MIRTQHLFTALALLLTLVTPAQEVAGLALGNRLSILNDKAFFIFPEAAVNSARSANIMSADPNVNKETRIMLELGEQKLVFFAQELYLLAGNDMFASVSKQESEYKFQTKVLTDNAEGYSILSTPTVFDNKQEAILIQSLLVKAQDNTLFRIDAYINPEAYKEKEEFITLTEKIFKTLLKGTRKTNLAAHEETLKIFGTDKSFVFSLPANYCITVDQKYDFQVFKFHKYVAFGSSEWLGLTIYTGHHPSYFYSDYGLEKNDAKEVKGIFLGEKVKWMKFYSKQQQTYLKEEMFKDTGIEKDLVVHIAMYSDQEPALEELTKIIEELKVKK